jgi:hypothetical protein
MKKLLYTLLAVSLIFSACEEEDTAPNTNNNTVVNNDPSNLIGEWHSEYYYSSDNGPYTFYHKINFYSNGDSFHRLYSWGNVSEYNSAYETPNNGFVNFESHSFYTPNSPPSATLKYCKYNINGNTLTITDLDGQSIYCNWSLDDYDYYLWMDALYSKQ